MLELLRSWLPNQRWFAGKGRDFDVVAVTSSGWLRTDPPVRVEFVTVRYSDGMHEVYQLPVEYRWTPVGHLGHACLGEIDVDLHGEGEQRMWLYDALHDKEVTGSWLSKIRDGAVLDRLAFHLDPAAPEFPIERSLVS